MCMRLVSFAFVVVLITSFIHGPTINKVVRVNKVVYSAVVDLPFSEENFMIVMKRFGIRFPEIVLAQAKLETGNFSSKIFLKNNNLFGMKVARTRLTVATGERHGHANYEHWTYSVMDYALYQSTYAKRVRTRDGYFKFLSRGYAENDRYIESIKNLID